MSDALMHHCTSAFSCTSTSSCSRHSCICTQASFPTLIYILSASLFDLTLRCISWCTSVACSLTVDLQWDTDPCINIAGRCKVMTSSGVFTSDRLLRSKLHSVLLQRSRGHPVWFAEVMDGSKVCWASFEKTFTEPPLQLYLPSELPWQEARKKDFPYLDPLSYAVSLYHAIIRSRT